MIEFDKNLLNDIELYCKENSIDSNKYATKLLRSAYMTDKYGDSPFSVNKVIVPDEVKEIKQEEPVLPVKKERKRKKIVKNTEIEEKSQEKVAIEEKNENIITSEESSEKKIIKKRKL